MIRNILFVITLLSLSVLVAYEPVLLRNSQFFDFEGTRVDLPNGATMLFWNDTSSGSSDVVAQKVNSEGTVLWSAPRPIAIGQEEQRIGSAVLASDGNIIVLYSVFSTYIGEVSYRTQKVSQAGQALWNSQGVLVVDDAASFGEVQLVPNTSGAAFVIYRDQYPGQVIFGINLDTNGTNLWPITPLCNIAGSFNMEALDDGAGGLIINNMVYISGQGTHNHLIRINAAGDVIGANPMLSPSASVPPGFYMLKDSMGNYILYKQLDTGLSLQKMDVNGNLLLPAMLTHSFGPEINAWDAVLKPIPGGGLAYSYFYSISNNQYLALNSLDTNLQAVWTQPVSIALSQFPDRLNMEVGNGFWLSWLTHGSDWYYGSVSSTRISPEGNMAFAPVLLIGEGNTFNTPAIISHADKAMVFWNEIRDDRIGMFAQLLSNSGSPLLPLEGVDIYGVLNGSTELKKVLAVNANNLNIYEDTRTGWNSRIYYQICTPEGNPVLEVSGRALNPDSQNRELYLESISASAGNSMILYSIYENELYGLFMQAIDTAGNTIWPGRGISVVSGSMSDFSRSLLSMVGNGVLVTWSSTESGPANPSIKGQLFSNGSPQWQEGGKVLLTSGSNYIYPQALQGNYLVVHHEDYTNNLASLKALKFDSNGDPAPDWPATGLEIISPSQYYTQYQHSGLMEGNLVVFGITINDLLVSTYAQMISPTAQKLWGQNGVTLVESDAWIISQVTDAAYGNGVTFIVQNSDTNDLFVQKLSLTGDLLWGETGCQIDVSSLGNYQSKLLDYANGTYSLVMTALNGQEQIGIRQIDISATGNLLNDAPNYITSGPHYLNNLFVVAHMNSGSISWNERMYYERGDALEMSSLWTCRLDASSVSVDDPTISPLVQNLKNYPNPFSQNTMISFSLKEAVPMKLDIFNLKGQHVRSLVNEAKTAGEYIQNWDGRDQAGHEVGQGIYYYKIQAGKFSSSKKMILLK